MSSTSAAGTRLEALSALGTSIWIDTMRRAMVTSGDLERLVSEDSVVGVTSNPSIFEKAILGSDDYDEALGELARAGAPAEDIYWELAVEDIQMAADVLRPVYDRTGGRDGYVSLEVAPGLARDTEGTASAAVDLHGRVDRPNVMIKIPGTPEGVEAIRRSIAAGININVTLLFSLDAHAQVADAYIAGLEERVARGEPIDSIASVASFFVSRVDTAVDRELDELGRPELKARAAVANARLAWALYHEIFDSDRFAALREHGASAQRVLWASTSTKDAALSDVMYVEELAGPEVVDTMPLATLYATQDHGEISDRLTGSEEQARRTLQEIEAAGVSMERVTERLLEEGIEKFADAMGKLLDGIARRRAAVVAGQPSEIEARLADDDAAAVGERVRWAGEHELLRRVWRKDHTLWPAPEGEAGPGADWLGWLTVSDLMLEHVSELRAFAGEVREAGFTDCALLGMGGSSLAPEVLRRTFGAPAGGLRLHVLDSTHPDVVAGLADELDLAHTLFVVSSKSGTTLEPNAFYAYFRERAEDPRQFVAVTDPGTALAQLARREGFRRVFEGVAEIGGRYSALSAFGIVPAALAGIDVEALLERAEVAVHAATPSVSSDKSSALWLGLAIGELARRGRDKLTFVVDDPPLPGFGLWAEQLVAESTGKRGTGIVPVAGEPLGSPDEYGEDRVFAHLRNPDAPDEDTDARLQALAAAGHPVLTLTVQEPLDLGAQLFLWELAVAIAGAVLEVNPFDQPNVQEAKDLTAEEIDAFARQGDFPDEQPAVGEAAVADLVQGAGRGDYVAILAYVPGSDATDRAIERLRRAIRARRRVATTAGYGPRYLHSTGQLHKGGPPEGRFIEITCDGREGVEVPGHGYGFDALVRAQAIGDLKALARRELPAVRFHISGDVAAGIERLAASIEEA